MLVRAEGGRIVAVEPLGAAAPAVVGAQRVEAPFAMPGLVDSHAHVSGYREGLPMGAPFEPAKHFLRLCALAGVTTVRDTGNSLETIMFLRDWGERTAAPRVFGSGPILDSPPLTWPFSRIVRDADDARREVDRLAAEGVDFLKAYARLTPDLVAAVVEAGREHDLDVAVDCHACSAHDAACAGARSIEHVANLLPEQPDRGEADGVVGEALRWAHVDLDDGPLAEIAALLVERGTFVTPTLLVHRRWASVEEMVADPYLELMVAVMPYHRHLLRMRGAIGMRIGRRYMARFMPLPDLSRSQRRDVEAGLARQAELAARLVAAGVRVVAGTDSPNPSIVPGYGLHLELQAMVAGGLAPIDALRCATSRAGELLRRPEIGAVAPGAAADVLVLGADATADIGATAQIERVLCRGIWVDRESVLDKVRAAIRDGEALDSQAA